MCDPLDAVWVVFPRVDEPQVAHPEVLHRAHHVGDVEEILWLVQDDEDTHRTNPECGMRNAESLFEVRAGGTTHHPEFRIPHFAFRVVVTRPAPVPRTAPGPAGPPAARPTPCRRSTPA